MALWVQLLYHASKVLISPAAAAGAADGDELEPLLSSLRFDGRPLDLLPFPVNETALTHMAGCVGERRVDVGLPLVAPGYQVRASYRAAE